MLFRETQFRHVDDTNFPTNVFHFVPNELILSQQNPQSHLIEVHDRHFRYMLLSYNNYEPILCLIFTYRCYGASYCKRGHSRILKKWEKSIYMVLELDDLDKGTIRCTLWEEFATQLVRHMQDNPTTEYILIIQFAKFNFFKGLVMGVSNINYNSILYINPDFKEVKDFRQSFIIGNDQLKNVLTQLPSYTSYSLEDDMLNRTPYKPICEIKELTENRNGWWYKGCKLCYRALKEEESSFYCMFCESFPNTHVPRFCIQLRVCDDIDNASFVIYDKEASRYLGISASDLRAAQLSMGFSKDDLPDELNSFIGKKFLFKISVKLDDINAFQPCKITVLKLCEDLQLISLVASKYNIYDENIAMENFEIQSIQTNYNETPRISSGFVSMSIKLIIRDSQITKSLRPNDSRSLNSLSLGQEQRKLLKN
ncbi:hypothetical protein Ahy_B09g098866 [Arachis hypogaea]|uniref:Replication factor A C-terminal domain-containing protein n=1 Tax=Arachis hypogaea TaxID=3818 RepID=A0A444XSH3_ARAHY|nr:hypothetical protein Ahy_B09g098866 [Arachis hypogaea]